MHCKLRPPEPRQPFLALITTPGRVWSRSTYPLPYYSVFAADTLWPLPLTLRYWALTFDLEHLQCIACDVMKLGAKFERNRAIRGGVIAISVFDLMTLNTALRVALGSRIFTKFNLRQLIRAWIIAFFDANTLWHAVTLTFDPMTLKVRYIKHHVIKVCTKFERTRAIAGWIIDNFANLCTRCHAVTLTFDLTTLNFYSTSGVLRLNYVQNLSEIE